MKRQIALVTDFLFLLFSVNSINKTRQLKTTNINNNIIKLAFTHKENNIDIKLQKSNNLMKTQNNGMILTKIK